MLKVYVGANIRLHNATDGFVNKLKKLKRSDDGFASAEMIALAVVGVLLVFGVYTIFKKSIDAKLEDWVNAIFDNNPPPDVTPSTSP